MSVIEDAKFTCEGCGRTYRWKQELAGRKVKCKCGHVMTAPEAPPMPELPPQDDGLFDLAPSAEASMPVRPARPVVAEAAAPAAPVIPYRSAPKQERVTNVIEGSPGKDFYIPIAMVVIGTLIQFGYYMSMSPNKVAGLAAASVAVGVTLVINFCIMFLGCLIATKAGMGFGHPLQAILKLAAIAVVVPAIDNVISHLVGFGFAGWGASLLAYFIFFMWLFDLDGSEAKLLVGIVWGLNVIVSMFLMAAILSMFR